MLTIRLILCAFALIAFEAVAEINVWQGHALPNHIPGSDAHPVWYAQSQSQILTTLWFNDSSDRATFKMRNAGRPLDAMPSIYCAVAGQEGPLLWQAPPIDQIHPGIPGGVYDLEWSISAEELFASEGNAQCGATVNNIASLKAAAEQRLLYVEVGRDSERYRTQLWPDIDKGAGGYLVYEDRVVTSTRQVIGRPAGVSESKKSMDFLIYDYGRTVGLFGYHIWRQNIEGLKITDVTLHCAPAGETGPKVADLEFGFLADAYYANWLHNEKITPTSPASPCGMEINNIASLTEALFRGNLYVLLTREDGMLWRGQLTKAQKK